MARINIGKRWIGNSELTYFVADIGANHDGKIERAKSLIYLAKEAGSDAVKFQNFRAPKIVSRHGFESFGGQLSHQATWKKSVYEVYQDASIPFDWTPELKKYCDEVGIHYFSTPYDFEAVDMLEPYVPVYKIGSGDITWLEMLRKVANKGKPIFLATGASDIGDVQRAVHIIREIIPNLVLMQCNTNYTGCLENFKYVNLNVILTYKTIFKDVVLGLSDHTPGHTAVLGAVALGAKVIEKHFTDDNYREGPDHAFAMNPITWREMVEQTRKLEYSLGSGDKQIEENEKETVILQRRCLRAAKDLKVGTILLRDMIEVLRPCPSDAIFPYDINMVIGRRLRSKMLAGEYFTWNRLE